MVERVPMTQEAYARRKAEIDEMENVQMPAIAEKIATARAEGDLKENAEYHAQREAQGKLQAKIHQLRSTLQNAQIVDSSMINKDEVAFGATVTVMDDGLEEVFQLVGEGDEDYDNNKYKITSPIGQGLLGKKVGEVATIPVPKGTIKLEIIDIKYDD